MRGGGELGHEALKGLQIRGYAFEYEVDLAREHPALAHQRLPAHELFELLEVGVGLARQVHQREHRDVIAQELGVEERPIALDVAGLFERAQTSQARRGRDPDAASELHVGDPAVVLKLLQNPAVEGIEAIGQAGSSLAVSLSTGNEL